MKLNLLKKKKLIIKYIKYLFPFEGTLLFIDHLYEIN